MSDDDAGIPAIPRYFKGQRYRSTLEARWAVFFDSLAIPFTYEGDSFRLSTGKIYSPDFWFPTWNKYIEIKPWQSTHAAAWMQCIRLQQEHNVPALMIVGEPWPEQYLIRLWSDHERRAFRGRFTECLKCGALAACGEDWFTPLACDCEVMPSGQPWLATRLMNAFQIATKVPQ